MVNIFAATVILYLLDTCLVSDLLNCTQLIAALLIGAIYLMLKNLCDFHE